MKYISPACGKINEDENMRLMKRALKARKKLKISKPPINVRRSA